MATCHDRGHIHTPGGCTGPPTPSDLWAGVSPSVCDCPAPAADPQRDRMRAATEAILCATEMHRSKAHEVHEGVAVSVCRCDFTVPWSERELLKQHQAESLAAAVIETLDG